MKVQIFIVGSLLANIIIFSGCVKNCKEVKYYFSMNQVFLPEKDSIFVSDTVWLTSSHSTTFNDTITNHEVNFSNAQLGTNIRILSFSDSLRSYVGVVDNFEEIKVFGTETGNNNIPKENKGVHYEEKDGKYLLKFGFIAKKRGTYLFSVGNDISVIRSNNGCEKADVQITNANANNHIYIIQNWFPGYEIPNYERTHSYCFTVK